MYTPVHILESYVLSKYVKKTKSKKKSLTVYLFIFKFQSILNTWKIIN